MTELMTALMVWIHALTALPIPDRHPNIVFAEPCLIERIHTKSSKCSGPGDGPRALAIYRYSKNTIYLSNTWSASSLADVGVLLHELVHHMQAHSGLDPNKVACPGSQMERPAYDAQIKFLRAAGVDPWETMGLPENTYVYLTLCRGQ